MFMDKLISNAATAEQTIKALTQRLVVLQRVYEQQRQQREEVEIRNLTNANEALKQQVQNLKFDLECLRVQNGVRCIPLPKSKPESSLSIASQPNESSATLASANPVAEKSRAPEAKGEKKKEIKEKKKEVKDNKKDKTKSNASAKSDDSPPIDGSRLDLRVGKIVHVEKHPDADTLYVEKVDLGEDKPRTIVSGLVANLTLEEMQDRVAVFMCNLKPVKMRGIFSEGMIMCATTPEKVFPLLPPNGAVIGDKVRLQGYTAEPDELLSPKKKVWEQIKPDMLVNADGIATYKGREFFIEGKGPCISTVLKNCQIS